VIDKAAALLKEVGPLGHPRAARQDLVGALIDAADADYAAKALTDYNPKLGAALAKAATGSEVASDGQSQTDPLPAESR